MNMSFETLDSILYENAPHVNYEEELNIEQLDAVMTLEGPVLIIAGAGSGKTRTLTYRLSNMIEKGVNPERILLLTFTNKAADEMVARAKQMLDDRCDKVTACTYHSFCANVLRRHANMIGFDSSFVIHDSVDAVDTINLVRSNLGHARDADFPKGRELSGMFGTHVNKGTPFDEIIEVDYPKYKGYEDEVELMFAAYGKYKKDHNILDYDDLLVQMNKLLYENENVRRSLSDRYQYIMVDEYQDSNALQSRMLMLLRWYENKNLCVVGDDFQSIYGFRGSEVKNIINFPQQFKNCKIITLNRNYRSNQEILDLSNAVTENASEKYDKQLIGLHNKGEQPRLVVTEDSRQQSKYVLNKILEYMDKGIPLSDMAILIRKSNDSYALEALIRQVESMGRHIPVQKFGGIKFFEKAHVKDVLAYIKILINHKDEVSWFRILQLYPNVGPVYARRMTEGIVNNGITELLDKKHTTKKYGKLMPSLYDTVSELQKMSFQDQLDAIINKYYVEARENMISIQKGATKEESKLELDDEIKELQILLEIADGYKSGESFITDLTLDAKDKEENGEKLTISTIHSAKGLEFKVVFILNCTEGTFPCVRAPKSNTEAAYQKTREALEEERRIFYVAVTRAKDDLYLMYPKTITQYNSFQASELSRFLLEDGIYEEYTEIESIDEYGY